MSLHNFNPNNKSWKMYSNTLTSISGDNLTIKPYDGKNLLLEVSGNNNIFFKRGDISYGLDDLIGGGNSNITLTSVSGDIIPSTDNVYKLGDVSKNWSNAYINDLSVSNISVSGNILFGLSGGNITSILNAKANSDNPTFTGTVTLPANSINSSHIQNRTILGEDISTGTIDLSNLSTSAITNLQITPANSINSSHIINGTLLAEDIADLNITSAKIADLNVTEGKIAGLAVTEGKIGALAVTTGKIADLNVTSAKIADLNVTTAKIADLNVTTGKIADLNVTTGKIADLNVTTGKIADLAVTDAKIANTTISLGKLSASAITTLQTTPASSINSSHIQDGTLTGGDIAIETITNNNIANLTLGGEKISNFTITSEKIANYTIGGEKLVNNTITNQNIANETITKFQIAPNAITNEKIASSAVLAINIATGAVNSSHIQTGSILGEDISAGTINLSNLSASAIASLQSGATPAPNSINSSHIINGSILTEDISNNAITNIKIADFSISNSKLQDDSIDSRKIIAGSILGTDIATNQIGVSHLTGTAYLDLTTAQAENSINSSHIVNGSITGSDIAGTTITGSNIANTTITYDKLNSNITSLITNSNISRNYIGQTDVVTDVLIPIDLVNNEFVDVNLTIRFSNSFNGNNRLWCLFYNGSYYNFKFFRISGQATAQTNPWVYSGGIYTGMTMWDMENSPYWRPANIRMRVYREGLETDQVGPRLFNVEGDSFYSIFGAGPVRGTIQGQIEYKPTHIYFYVPSGTNFIAKYWVTNYK